MIDFAAQGRRMHGDETAAIDRVERRCPAAAFYTQLCGGRESSADGMNVKTYEGALACDEANAVAQVLNSLRHLQIVGDQIRARRRRCAASVADLGYDG